MSIKIGDSVTITRQGLLSGQIAEVTGLDDSGLIQVTLADGTIAMLAAVELDKHKPLTQADTSPTTMVRLPHGTAVKVDGRTLEAVLCVVKVTPDVRRQLEDAYQQELQDVQIDDHSTAGDDFGPPPMEAVPAQSAYPQPMGYAVTPPPMTAAMGVDYSRIQLARGLLESFMHMRHHMVEAAGGGNDNPLDVEGDEWKQRVVAENAHIFEFSHYEEALYRNCCEVLSAFLKPPAQDKVDPHPTLQ